MGHQPVSSEVQDDQFEQVPGAVGSGEQVTPGIVAPLGPGDRLGHRAFEVLVGEVVTEQRKRFGVGAAPGGDLGPAGGDEIHGGEVLEHLDGIGGGQHADGAGEPDALGGLGDRREHHRCGKEGHDRAVSGWLAIAGSVVTWPAVATPLQRSISPARSRWSMGAELS